MSGKYRIKATPGGVYNYVVQRKRFPLYWKDVRRTDYPEDFESIVRRDMKDRNRVATAESRLKAFKPIHAVVHWYLPPGKTDFELRVVVDTKA